MLKSAPSLKALRAFEAVARHLSVSRAATELEVTQPAVSQQIRVLESFLGQQLLRRQGQGIALTPAGRAYAQRLHGAFSEIEAATLALLRQGRKGDVLTISLLPTLAQRWLIPRLASLQMAVPEAEIRLSATARVVDLDREDVDIAVRYGDGNWRGCQSDPLMANDTFPVLSKRLLDKQPIESVEDLSRHVWLHVDAEPRDKDWQAWLDAAGASGLKPKRRIAFESSSYALAAAAAGLGVAIGHRPFVMDDLTAGRLVAPLEITTPSAGAYYVVTSRNAAASPCVSACRDWLLGEVGECQSI
jgi:LysR family transcriptional regulator, glycine cleavage system transcriptional activator